jgi:hypothetical protein
MEMIYSWLVIFHFIGLASLVGGFLVQMRVKPRKVNAAMFHGALTQLVTGLALVGLIGAELVVDKDVDYNIITVKLLITLVVTYLVIKNRKKESVTNGLYGAIGGLSILNIVIAVLF